jgi:hypothetical protein
MLPTNTKLTLQLKHFVLLLGVFLLVACSKPQSTHQPITLNPITSINLPSNPSITPTPLSKQNLAGSPTVPSKIISSPSPIIDTTHTSDVTSTVTAFPTVNSPNNWMSLPVIPSVSLTARTIYQRGIEIGNDPHAFSKIGDCQSISTYFLSYFDMPGFYNLGDFTSLQQTIDWYAGSFSRDSLAVKGGFNAAAILSPLRADPKQCKPDENPISCEFRLHNPSVAIISLEEWWAGHPENYAAYLRQIIVYSIDKGVVPILATKADNLEGNNLINQTIASLAQEYDIPLWNFWAAVQSLPNHGLIAANSSGEVDMFHLTHSEGYYFYNDPAATQSGWSVRNLTALQALDAVRRGLSNQP